MLNLIRNENMKIYRRMRTWIMFLLLGALVVGISILLEKNQPAPENWKQQAIEENASIQKTMDDNNLTVDAASYYTRTVAINYTKVIAINEYRIKEDIAPPTGTIWGGVLEMGNLIVLVTIFTVIIAADSVAGEFSSGTIKMLLIRPKSRGKVLLSKYLASLLFSLGMLIFLFAIAFVTNGLIYGFDGSTLVNLYASSEGIVHEQAMPLHILSSYGLSSVTLLMTVTLAFTISTIFRSSSLSIGLSMAILFLSDTMIQFLSRYSWIKYYLFANTHLIDYIEGTPLRDDMTLSFSIMALIGYFLLLNFLSWGIFSKRDVTA
ncbi:MAG: ABC transporter permease [Gorillibacterium sp.]|nr:ABC transporter permease [Gorillibacterium sp.]